MAYERNRSHHHNVAAAKATSPSPGDGCGWAGDGHRDRRHARLSAPCHGKILPLKREQPPSETRLAVSIQLVPGTNDLLRVEAEVAQRIGITIAEAQAAQLADSLQLSGTLTLDVTHLQEVRSRFAGEVADFGKTPDGSRPIQFGDRVAKNQLLAVVWSRELGEKKANWLTLYRSFTWTAKHSLVWASSTRTVRSRSGVPGGRTGRGNGPERRGAVPAQLQHGASLTKRLRPSKQKPNV